MRLFMVAVIKKEDKIVGFRVLDVDSKQAMNIECKSVVGKLKAYPGCIENMTYENGIKCINGDMTRYGVYGKSVSLVILDQICDASGEVVGYNVSDTNGIMKTFKKNDVLTIAEKYGVANGKVVEKDGKKFISAINGAYNTIKVNEHNNENDVSNNKNTAMSNKTIEHDKGNEDSNNTVNSNTAGISDKSDLDKGYELVYRIVGGTYYVSAVIFNLGKCDVVIPDTHNGIKVTGIGVRAFDNRNEMASIKIGKNIVDIGNYAFNECYRLESVDFSLGGHTKIPIGCFYKCRKLNEVKIGNKVEKIHKDAFFYCGIESIEIPKTCKSIGESAFSGCLKLAHINGSSIETIGSKAFRGCNSLEEFEFKSISRLGSRAFENTKLKYIIVPSKVKKVPQCAFELTEANEVNIEEGVEEIGFRSFVFNTEETINVYMPKSVNAIDTEAFYIASRIVSNRKDNHDGIIMHVYHGTTAESYCVNNNMHIEYIDRMTKENTSTLRVRSEVIGDNIIDMIYHKMSHINEEFAKNANIDFNIDTKKLTNLAMTEQMYKFLGICVSNVDKTSELSEFQYRYAYCSMLKYAVNTEQIFKEVLSPLILRAQNLFFVESKDDINAYGMIVSRISFTTKDTLERINFMIFIRDNTLQYVCKDIQNLKCNLKEKITEFSEDNLVMTVPSRFLCKGDIIELRRDGMLSAKRSLLETESKTINVGRIIYRSLIRCTYIEETSKRGYFIDNISSKAIHAKITPDMDRFDILEVIDEQEIYSRMNGKNKISSKSEQQYNKIKSMDSNDIVIKSSEINIVGVESISNLWVIANKLKNIGASTVEDMGIELLREVADSYWLISKGADWMKTVKTSTLTQTNSYKMGEYVVDEYISSQIVRFQNSFMTGGRESYVFTVSINGRVIEAYASRMSLEEIKSNLVNITDYDHSAVSEPIERGNENKFKSFEHDMFFKFYDIVPDKEGYQFSLTNERAMFALSMFKPTGVLYVVANLVEVEVKDRGSNAVRIIEHNTYPIFKVGNIDRALEVAGSTEAKRSKENKVTAQWLSRLVYGIKNGNSTTAAANTIEARKLMMAGERDIDKYIALIDRRICYMIGVKAQGQLSIHYSKNDAYADKTRIIIDDDVYEDYELDISDDTSINSNDDSLGSTGIEEDYDVEFEAEDDEHNDIEYEVEDDEEISSDELLAMLSDVIAGYGDVSQMTEDEKRAIAELLSEQ